MQEGAKREHEIWKGEDRLIKDSRSGRIQQLAFS